MVASLPFLSIVRKQHTILKISTDNRPKKYVVEIKDGKKVVSKKRSFPGYILVKLEMNDKNWYKIVIDREDRIEELYEGNNVVMNK